MFVRPVAFAVIYHFRAAADTAFAKVAELIHHNRIMMLRPKQNLFS